MFKLMVGKQKKKIGIILKVEMSHSEKSIKGVDKSDPFDKFCFKKKKRNNLQKQSFFLKKKQFDITQSLNQ